MIINLTNHSAAYWNDEQLAAARKWGEVYDYPFPCVPPDVLEGDISEIADGLCKKVEEMHPEAVICQGEFTLTFALVTRLLKKGIPVLAACSERRARESLVGNVVEKISEYEFQGFRRYIV